MVKAWSWVLVWMLLAGGARAEGLKVATWNLEWLTLRAGGDRALPRDVVPREPGDLRRLAGYAAQLDADVVAFEEVDGEGAAAAVFPAGTYVLHLTADGVVQRVGIAVRRGIPFTVNADDTALDVSAPGAEHRLRSGADVTLLLPQGRRLRLLAVHLKSGCQRDGLESSRPACGALRAQLVVLRAWIAAREAEGVAYAVLGDMNRVMDGGDAMLAALLDTAPLGRPTEGFANPCWGGERFIDHILLGGPAIGWMVPGSLRVMVYREVGGEWRHRLSDHCPVSVRLAPAG